LGRCARGKSAACDVKIVKRMVFDLLRTYVYGHRHKEHQGAPMSTDTFDYDLFVIGGGSGGVRAARVAAGEYGAKVALAEDDRYGGTCVIRGCVPKKLMVFASGYGGMVEEANAYGWDIKPGAFDWTAFRSKLNAELDRLEGVYRKLLGGANVETFDLRASIKDAHTVALSDGSTKTAKHILIATGGHPVRPDIPNAELGMVSDDLFHMEELPKSILIIGGGYIACEFACVLNGLGVEVTQYYRGAQVLRGFDEEARGLVSDQMCESGIDLHLGTNILEMKPGDGGHGVWVNPPRVGKTPLTGCSLPPGACRPVRTWGWRRSALSWAVGNRSLWMTIARPPCPRSMRLAM